MRFFSRFQHITVRLDFRSEKSRIKMTIKLLLRYDIIRSFRSSPVALFSSRYAPNTQKDSFRCFQTKSVEKKPLVGNTNRPGSVAFADCETDAIADLFYHFAKINGGVDDRGTYLSYVGVREILKSIGERHDDEILEKLMHVADSDRDGKLYLQVHDAIHATNTQSYLIFMVLNLSM
jgi:hypothetical protein